MLPPYLRAILKHVDETVDKTDRGAQDRSKRAEETQSKVVAAIDRLTNEFRAYQVEQAKAEGKKNRREKLTIASLIVTAAITFALAITAALQYGTLEKQWVTLERTDATSRKTNRAFIALRPVEGVAIGPSREGDDFLYRIPFQWENSGNTATESLEIGFDVTLMAAPIPVPLWAAKNHFPVVLLPKSTYADLTMYIMGKQANEVRDKKGFMFVRPFAQYKDAFGDKHLTLACFMLRAEDVDYTKAGGVGITGSQCAEYNCADSDCLRYKSGPFASPQLSEVLKYLEE